MRRPHLWQILPAQPGTQQPKPTVTYTFPLSSVALPASLCPAGMAVLLPTIPPAGPCPYVLEMMCLIPRGLILLIEHCGSSQLRSFWSSDEQNSNRTHGGGGPGRPTNVQAVGPRALALAAEHSN